MGELLGISYLTESQRGDMQKIITVCLILLSSTPVSGFESVKAGVHENPPPLFTYAPGNLKEIYIDITFPKNSQKIRKFIEKMDYYITAIKNNKNSVYLWSNEENIVGEKTGKMLPTWIKRIFLAVGGLLVLFIVISLIMRGEVRKKTAELLEKKPILEKEIYEHKETKEKLELYKKIYTNSKDAIAVIDPRGYYIDQNDAHRSLFGYSDDEVRGKTPAIQIGDEAFSEIIKEISDKGSYRGELNCHTKSGKNIHIELSAFPVLNRKGEVVCYIGINRDITERKLGEEELKRVNGALKTLSECNRAIIRATDESRFLNEICRIIVKVGSYRLAWIGLIEQDRQKTVCPVAQFGYEEGYPKTVKTSWGDREWVRVPTDITIRNCKTFMVMGILSDYDYKPWREGGL